MTKQPTSRNYRPYMKFPNAPVKHIDPSDQRANQCAEHMTNRTLARNRRRDKNLGQLAPNFYTQQMNQMTPEELEASVQNQFSDEARFFTCIVYKHSVKWISRHHTRDEREQKILNLRQAYPEDMFSSRTDTQEHIEQGISTPQTLEKSIYDGFLAIEPQGQQS